MTRREHEVCQPLETVRDIHSDFWIKMPVSSDNPDGTFWSRAASQNADFAHWHFKKVLKVKGHTPFCGFLCERGGQK